MLRLTQIELLGFKSFPHKTVLDLSSGINCVVGPNGSGKSNIADAIMFAFGSQSSRELRAPNMSSIIFAGTEQLRPLNLASVTLHFRCSPQPPAAEAGGALGSLSARAEALLEQPAIEDAATQDEAALLPWKRGGANLTRHIPATVREYKDPTPAVMKQLEELRSGDNVSLTRRVFRDGSGGYFINGEAVRLKDVDGFFDRFSLGRSAVFSINQGDVERKILAGPQEMRQWLAEATGVALLLAQKQRAEQRLKRARVNLTRLSDIARHTGELVEDLARQKELAEKHIRCSSELRSVELNEIKREIELAQRQLDSSGQAETEARQQLADARERFEQLRLSIAEQEERSAQLGQGLSAVRARQQQALERLEELRRSAAVAGEALKAAEAARVQAESDREETARALELIAAELSGAESDFEQAKAACAAEREAAGEHSARFNAAKQALEALSAEQAATSRAVFDLAQLRTRVSNELEAQTRHGEQIEAQLEARSRHLEAVAARAAEIEADYDREVAAREGLEQACALQGERLRGLGDELQGLREALKQADEELALARTELAGLRARHASLSTLDDDSGRAGRLRRLLTEDAVLSANVQQATALTFPPELRAAFTRLLAHLSDALVADPSALDALLAAAAAAGEGEALLLLPAAPPALHADSLWRQAQCAPQVLGALTGMLGDVLLADTSAAARALLDATPQAGAAVLRDGSALFTRRYVYAGQPSAERAGRVTLKTDLAELAAQSAARAADAARLEQAAQGLRNRQQELAAAREEVAAQLAGSQERLKGAGQLTERLGVSLRERRAEHELLASQLEHLRAEREKLGAGLPALQAQLAQAQADEAALAAQNAALAERRSSADSELDSARSAYSEHGTRLELLKQQLRHSEQACLNYAERRSNLRNRATQFEARLAQLRTDADSARGQSESSAAGALELEGELTELRAELAGVDERMREQSARLGALREEQGQSAIELSRLEQDQAHLASARDKAAQRLEEWLAELQDRFGLSLSALLTDPALIKSPQHAQLEASEAGRLRLREEKSRLREELDRLGTVNLLAIEQHGVQSERYGFLTGQIGELARAADDLSRLVSDLDEGTEERYTAQLKLIEARFGGLFTRLFGGGSARLRFVTPRESAAAEGVDAPDAADAEGESAPSGGGVINAGVEVEVQLPGSRRMALRSLSGGQRSMIFMALFFAVHSTRSPGFCILDEADAALDDANVARFSQLLEHFAAPAEAAADGEDALPRLGEQIIVVTHNKRTMEIADKLIGVVGRPKGVSNLLAVDLKNAKKLADKAAS